MMMSRCIATHFSIDLHAMERRRQREISRHVRFERVMREQAMKANRDRNGRQKNTCHQEAEIRPVESPAQRKPEQHHARSGTMMPPDTRRFTSKARCKTCQRERTLAWIATAKSLNSTSLMADSLRHHIRNTGAVRRNHGNRRA